MFATHVDLHDLVTACTCLSALQSAASVGTLATMQTAAQWGRTLITATTQQRTEHTIHSATEAADVLLLARHRRYYDFVNARNLIMWPKAVNSMLS